MSFEERRRAMIKAGEGSIPHMYLDTVGKVTVGVGNMLPDVGAAQALSFVHRDGGAPADAAAIAADFESVSGQEKGRLAGSYKAFTKLDMPQDAIDALLDARIAEFEEGLRRNYEGYDGFPEPARLGLLDMAFNLGIGGVVNKFPSFTRAARAQDWATCAKECHRRGIGERRNEETRKLFEEAAAG